MGIVVEIVQGVVVERVARGLRSFDEELAVESPAGIAVVTGESVMMRVGVGGQAGHREGSKFGGGDGARRAAGQLDQAA